MDDVTFPSWAEFLIRYFQVLIGPESRLWPGYIILFILIGFAVYRYEGRKSGFWKYIFPAEMYFTRSVATDVKLFMLNALLGVSGIFNFIFSRAFVAITVMDWLGGNTTDPTSVHPIFIALLLFMVGDYLLYWLHRIHHNHEPLWVFHAVHHSAEVLVPVSNYRAHPLYMFFNQITRAFGFGLVDGVLIALFVSSIEFETLLGVNLLTFIYTATGNNLRHSHIWLSYGPYLSYLLISPAMHQIHHSRDPKHYNKNYGGALAIFDWMAGTLYIPKEREELEFGLCDAQGNAIQPHDGLGQAFFVPFKHLGQWWARRKSKQPTELQRARYNR